MVYCPVPLTWDCVITPFIPFKTLDKFSLIWNVTDSMTALYVTHKHAFSSILIQNVIQKREVLATNGMKKLCLLDLTVITHRLGFDHWMFIVYVISFTIHSPKIPLFHFLQEWNLRWSLLYLNSSFWQISGLHI